MATEKDKGQQTSLTVRNASGTQRLSSYELKQAQTDLDTLFTNTQVLHDLELVADARVDRLQPRIKGIDRTC